MENLEGDIVTLTDSDDDTFKTESPLTSIKQKKRGVNHRISTPRGCITNRNFVHRNNTESSIRMDKKKQTKIDNFFCTNRTRKNKSLDPVPTRQLNQNVTENIGHIKLSPLKRSSSLKRPALKGLSPQAKSAREKPKIYNLKGRDLLQAYAPGKSNKERSLEDEFNIKPLLHFHRDKETHTNCDNSSTQMSNDEDISNDSIVNPYSPVPEDPNLVIRPMSSLCIKKHKTKSNKHLSTSGEQSHLLTSTPVKSRQKHIESEATDSEVGNQSTDLFSDNSLLTTSIIDNIPPLSAKYGRHVVVDCSQGESNVVMMLEDMNGVEKSCELRGFWADTKISRGDIVNIVGEFDANNHILIDMKNNMLILNPDYLVSGSVIASATTCVRRAVLNDRYKGYDAGNKYMLLGSILHAIFQRVLVLGVTDQAVVRQLALQIAHTVSYAHDMYAIGMTEKSLVESIEEYIPPMCSFVSRHTGQNRNGGIHISNVTDIEETVWSPRFGMKGKIDVTVKIQRGKKKCTLPLELKTGRPSYSAEHRGQVTMYSMMLADKINNLDSDQEDTASGLLVYLKDGSMQEIKNSETAIKGLVQLRNELCQGLLLGVRRNEDRGYTVDKLPEPINQERICLNCPQQLACAMHQRVFDGYQPEPGDLMETLVPEALGHLSEAHLNYFREWSTMLLLESAVEVKWKKISDMWCRPLNTRKEYGTCLSDLLVTDVVGQESLFYHTLTVDNEKQDSKRSHQNNFSPGDMVAVSEQGSHVVVLVTGCLVIVSEDKLTVQLDRYQIDKYDFYNSDGVGFSNLVRLMEDTHDSAQLRNFIIDHKPPEFESDVSERDLQTISAVIDPLNNLQRQAVLQCLSAKHFMLIRGYPGTGKTSTIVAVVKALRLIGKSVLLTSYTNSAVDNILCKLKKEKVNFIRLGKMSKVHPDLQSYSSEYLTSQLKTVDEIQSFYSCQHVVGTTCLGISHALFAQRRFDVCIVDEASQILLPMVLGPLFHADKFILVGDKNQLPPLVRSSEAQSLGMTVTLSDTLEKNGIYCELTSQYRMNSEIMRLCNELVYNDSLVCGTDMVGQSTIETGVKLQPNSSWKQLVVASCLEHSVVMLDTISFSSASGSDQIQSRMEATLVESVCNELIMEGIEPSDIGIITPYRAQVRLLCDILKYPLLEVNTVDQYQGRDKDVIIISFVKSSVQKHNKAEGILSNVKRLNVAITRAKYKLILIGNRAALTAYRPVNDLLNILRDDQVITLSENWQE